MMRRTLIAVATGLIGFVLLYLIFAYLAITGALVLPFLLLGSAIAARQIWGSRLPLLLAFIVAPLCTAETLAGWSRFLQGENPGGPNALLVVIHGALIVTGGAVLLSSVRTAQLSKKRPVR